jgi:hypothetical protein
VNAGLTFDQVVRVIAPNVPTDLLGGLMERLPEQFFDKETGTFRPVVPAILLAISTVEPSEDAWIADIIDFASADPAPDPKVPFWIDLADGGVICVRRLLDVTGARVAALYAPKPPLANRKTTTTVA